ncbi:MAG: BON domain-containing protein [Methylibium sp.]|nr:BON domain-containing protein [Methylibium sp.]
MKTDADLKRDVEAELAWDPTVRSTAVGVAVKDGVVTMTGHLDTFAEKHAVERALRRVAGVKAIALELDVKLSLDHQRSDTDIANAAELALKWNTLVPVDQIRVVVDKGWISLQGEVEWDHQRRSVEKAIRPLMGVHGISNEITLKPKTAPADVARHIKAALMRQAEREAKHMDITVDGATVTLRGQVNSWHERFAAQGAAWQAPGVRTVINELKVS